MNLTVKSIFLNILIYGVLVVAGFITLSSVSFAQEEDSEKAKKYGIVFPIADLGNCGNISECRNYCNNESNRESCMDFAKKKGFYKQSSSKSEEMISDAKTSLGCDSENSCRAFCEKEENINKCREFAKRYGMNSGPNDGILKKAKEFLGCDTPQSCKAVCEQESNREKCMNFARSAGLSSGETRTGPGGCNSEESCRAFCEKEENRDECSKFGGGRVERNMSGPGGCNSEQSCRAYCEKNPQECGRNGSSNVKHYDNKEDFCKENPKECERFKSEEENLKRMHERSRDEQKESFCKEHPQECARKFNRESGYDTSSPQPSGSYTNDSNITVPETPQVQGISTQSIFRKIRSLFF